MITFTQGNIFEADCEAIVNTVNTKGIMGKGLALQFKKNYPENFIAYEKACKNNKVKLGQMFLFNQNSLSNPNLIINFPTKDHWKSKSNISDIETGLFDMIAQMKKNNIKSVAIPPLGCGLGGLPWNKVKQVIIDICEKEQEIDFVIYEPLAEKNPAPKVMKKEKLTELRAVMLSCIKRYIDISSSPNITLLEIHKICYFLQELGVPLRLQFKPYIYGPFAVNLPHVLEKLEGSYITGFGDGTIGAFDNISLMNENLSDVDKMVSSEYREKINKTIDFVFDYAYPVGVELLATVHWLLKHDKVSSDFETVKKHIHDWGKKEHQNWGARKIKYFKDRDIKLAIEHLSQFIK